MKEKAVELTWQESFLQYLHPRVITMLFLGFSAGLPYFLIFSSLSLWLREAGVDRSTVTYFSFAALGYSFKFVWAPLVDKLPVPFLTQWLGRRRSWLLLSQIMVASSIVWMALINPAQVPLKWMAYAAVCLGFSSATQDIVTDAFRIESADAKLQAMMSSTYIAGYRIGLFAAGAGVLYLASALGSLAESYSYSAWRASYLIMAGLMGVGMITTWLVKEPEEKAKQYLLSNYDYVRIILLFVAMVSGFIAIYLQTAVITDEYKLALKLIVHNQALAIVLVETSRLLVALSAAFFIAWCLVKSGVVKRKHVHETYIEPVKDFFNRYGIKTALFLLLLIGTYRISDIVMGVVSNIFYQDLAFTKNQIATAVKSFGLGMTIVGGLLGGLLSVRFGVIKILLLGAILAALTNVLFLWLAYIGNNEWGLYLVIGADNLSAGLASAAFVAFLSSLTNISFTAMQYALFSSLMTLFPKVLGGYSGGMVEAMGYPAFFVFTACLGIPVIFLVILVGRILPIQEPKLKTG